MSSTDLNKHTTVVAKDLLCGGGDDPLLQPVRLLLQVFTRLVVPQQVLLHLHEKTRCEITQKRSLQDQKRGKQNLEQGVLRLLWIRLQRLSSIHDGNRHETDGVVPDGEKPHLSHSHNTKAGAGL